MSRPFGWDYPPGVNPNDPHLTGIWPIESIVDEIVYGLKKDLERIEDSASLLDDQNLLNETLSDQFGDIENGIQGLIDSVEALIPEQPGL